MIYFEGLMPHAQTPLFNCVSLSLAPKYLLGSPTEAGRVEVFQLGTTALEQWLEEADTDPDLTDSIVKYVQLIIHEI